MHPKIVGSLTFQSVLVGQNPETILGHAVCFKASEDGRLFAQQYAPPQLGAKGVLFEEGCFGPFSGHLCKRVAGSFASTVQDRNQVVDADGHLVDQTCNSFHPLVEPAVCQLNDGLMPSEERKHRQVGSQDVQALDRELAGVFPGQYAVVQQIVEGRVVSNVSDLHNESDNSAGHPVCPERLIGISTGEDTAIGQPIQGMGERVSAAHNPGSGGMLLDGGLNYLNDGVHNRIFVSD